MRWQTYDRLTQVLVQRQTEYFEQHVRQGDPPGVAAGAGFTLESGVDVLSV